MNNTFDPLKVPDEVNPKNLVLPQLLYVLSAGVGTPFLYVDNPRKIPEKTKQYLEDNNLPLDQPHNFACLQARLVVPGELPTMVDKAMKRLSAARANGTVQGEIAGTEDDLRTFVDIVLKLALQPDDESQTEPGSVAKAIVNGVEDLGGGSARVHQLKDGVPGPDLADLAIDIGRETNKRTVN